MKNPVKISRLKSVPISDVWKREDTDFTPWLALDENIELLSEELGMKLIVDAVEQKVGSFYADIVCKDESDGTTVLIENQTKPTDHRHLGQICTYAGQLKASKIIWISERVRDEHREAIDWLNDISNDKHSFYAVEVQAWQIDDSAPAPKFEILARPSLLTRQTQSAVKKIIDSGLSERQIEWKNYWTSFLEVAVGVVPSSKGRVAYKGNWQTVKAKSGFDNGYFEFNIAASQTYVRAECYIGGVNAKPAFYALREYKDEIEKKIGKSLIWEEKTGKQDSRIAIYMDNQVVNFGNSAKKQHKWMAANIQLLIENLEPFIESVDIAKQLERLSETVDDK